MSKQYYIIEKEKLDEMIEAAEEKFQNTNTYAVKEGYYIGRMEALKDLRSSLPLITEPEPPSSVAPKKNTSSSTKFSKPNPTKQS